MLIQEIEVGTGRTSFHFENKDLACIVDQNGYPMYLTKEALSPDDKKMIEDRITEICNGLDTDS